MKLQISDLKTDRQWGAATGCTKAQFEKLLVLFTASYFKLHGKSVAERQAEIEVTPSLSSEEDLLFFTLFSLKAGLTYDVLGFVSGMDGSNAKRNQTLGLKVLEQALESVQCLPRRKFKDAAEFAEYLEQEETLIFDGLEQRMQRPSDDEAQRDHYSGKKMPYPQGRDDEQSKAAHPVPERVLGRENSRLQDVPKRVPSGRKLVCRFPRARGFRLFGN